MQTLVVWLLICYSSAGSGQGGANKVAAFASKESCQFVLSQMEQDTSKARCIQANIVKDW